MSRAVIAAVALAGCTSVHDFVCNTDADCQTSAADPAVCELTNHFCATPNPTCASQYSYVDALDNQCVSATGSLPPPTSAGCIAQIRAGNNTTCVRETDDSVWCWGGGAATPAMIALPSGEPAGTLADLELGGAGLCLLYRSGHVYCAPMPTVAATQVALSQSATQIAVGANHACALTSNNKVSCWGMNNHGQLGDDTTSPRTGVVVATGLSDAHLVAAGGDESCATTDQDILANGEVWCWGADDQNQLGRGIIEGDTLAPNEISDPIGDVPPASLIAVGGQFACAGAKGNVWCWGSNALGQLGDPSAGSKSNTPNQISTLSKITQLTAGADHACVLDGSGQAQCWGNNAANESTTSSSLTVPTPAAVVDGAANAIHFREVAAGAQHTCGTTTTGTILCWGDNTGGELGNGGTSAAISPTPAQLICPAQ